MIYGIKEGIDKNLNLEAEDLDETRDIKVADDVEKNFIDERDNSQNKTDELADNGKAEDTSDQFGDQVENLAQKREDIKLDNSGNDLKDELDQLENNLPDKSNQYRALKTRDNRHTVRTSHRSLARPSRSKRPVTVFRMELPSRLTRALTALIATSRISSTS